MHEETAEVVKDIKMIIGGFGEPSITEEICRVLNIEFSSDIILNNLRNYLRRLE